jgi:dienelactone hydrolase
MIPLYAAANRRDEACIRISGRSRLSITALLLCAFIAMATGCARRFPEVEVTPIRAPDVATLHKYLLSRKPDVAEFRLRGPLKVVERKDMEIRLPSGGALEADLYLCDAAGKAPLVILVHGYGNSKEDHAFQAMHLASWGMHTLAVDMPKRGPWIANGRTLAVLVAAIRRNPRLVDNRIDVDRIVLSGHSFGATAVGTALGSGAPAVGGVLLDPAGIGRELPQLLRRIKAPVLVVGADEDIFPTRNRGQFFRFIQSSVGEISIRDTVHEDAQYPTGRTAHTFDEGPDETDEAQIAFVSALTASAFALAATGAIDFAWSSFEKDVEKGTFFNARRK